MTEHRWREALTTDEMQAMADLSVEPGYHDFPSDLVLEAYRRGRLDAGDEEYRE